MRDKHFYLTLPSNSSKRYYGKQIPNDYDTKLEHVVSLDPELWEVGLAQISYPKSWPNLPETSLYVSYPNLDAEPPISAVGPFVRPDAPATLRVSCTFGGIKFVSPRHLIRDLQKTVRDSLPEKHRDAIRIRYDEVAQRAKFTISYLFGLWMHESLARTLGVDRTIAVKKNYEGMKGYAMPSTETTRPDRETMEYTIITPQTVHVDRLTPTIFVYSDIVQQQIVGDAYVQLLRTIDVPDTGGDAIAHKFTNIHYVNLQTGTFESIKITITDSLGKLIDFKRGDVITVLHFRRKER